MRLAACALALALGCSFAHAQYAPDSQKKPETKKPAEKKHVESHKPPRTQERAREPKPGSPPPAANAPDRQPRGSLNTPTGSPSPAQQAQQKQLQYQQQNQPVQNQNQLQRQVQCSAYPACSQPGRTCQGVARTYVGGSAGSAKESIVQACVQSNRPDPCNCIQQCRQVARCSNI